MLEVYEDTATRRTRKQMKVALQMDPFTAQPLTNEAGEPTLVQGEDGRYIEATDLEPHAEVVVDTEERVRKGPAYRVVPWRDFVVLPEHAADKSEVWGYAKRFTRRLQQLRERVMAGAYDKDAVEALGTQGDQALQTDVAGVAAVQAPQHDPATVEKELWEVLLLRDLDGKGERWYVVTVSEQARQMLRVQHDDVGQARYMIFKPFPRSDRWADGFSFVGHKMITAIEEHTAWRNMLADRAALIVQAPIKRLEGALWDPTEVPWGPKAILDVRDMREIEPVQIPDMNAAAIDREREILQASERLAGINDVALGVNAQDQRTLGEVNLVAEQSFVRMDEVVKNLQETLEDLGALRHVIWRRALREGGDDLELPDGMLVGLETRGREHRIGAGTAAAARRDGGQLPLQAARERRDGRHQGAAQRFRELPQRDSAVGADEPDCGAVAVGAAGDSVAAGAGAAVVPVPGPAGDPGERADGGAAADDAAAAGPAGDAAGHDAAQPAAGDASWDATWRAWRPWTATGTAGTAGTASGPTAGWDGVLGASGRPTRAASGAAGTAAAVTLS